MRPFSQKYLPPRIIGLLHSQLHVWVSYVYLVSKILPCRMTAYHITSSTRNMECWENLFKTDCRLPEWSYKLNMATVDAALCVSLLWLLYLMRTSVSVSRFHWFGLKSVSLCTLTTCWQGLQPTRIYCIKAYGVSGSRKKCKKPAFYH